MTDPAILKSRHVLHDLQKAINELATVSGKADNWSDPELREKLAKFFEVLPASAWPSPRAHTEERKRTEEKLHTRTRTLEALNQISNKLVAELDLEKIVQAVTDAGREISGAAFGAFFYNVKNEKGEAYTLYTLSGVPREAFSKFPMPRNTAVFAPTFNGEGVVRVGDILKDPRYGKNAPFHGMPKGHLPVRSYLAVPVISRSGSVIGGLFFGHPVPDVFTEEAETLLTGIASQAAVAIDNANLYRDLQWQLEANKKSEEARARLSAIVEFSDDAILSKDLNGVIMSWNRGAQAIFGYTAEEVVGRSVTILIPEDRQNEEPMILSRIRRGETVDHYETIRQRKDGTLLDISLTVSPIRDGEGKIIGVSKIARDVTVRKRAEVALRQSEAQLKLLAEALPQMVWTARPDGYTDYFNKRWYDYTGFPEELKGDEAWLPILHPDDVARTTRVWQESLRTGQPYNIEYRFKDRLSGGYRWHLGRAVPLRNEAGEIIHWFGTCTDIDDQKRNAEKLEETVRERTAKLRETVGELEAFSYSIAHDMRAPLRAMQSFSQILKEECSVHISAEGQDYLRRIMTSAARMDRLIQDVLTYSKVARADIVLIPVDLNVLVRGILESYPELQSPHILIEVQEPLATVMGNEASLTQCFSNLLGNAAKFTAPGVKPRIRLWTERKGERVRIWVEDNGIGIPLDQQEKIFGIFQRISRNYDGTGIGLAIVKKAVQRMNGMVGVESVLGQGSRFWFELGRAEAA